MNFTLIRYDLTETPKNTKKKNSFQWCRFETNETNTFFPFFLRLQKRRKKNQKKKTMTWASVFSNKRLQTCDLSNSIRQSRSVRLNFFPSKLTVFDYTCAQ